MSDYIMEARLKLKDDFSKTLDDAKKGFGNTEKQFKGLKTLIGAGLGLGALKMALGSVWDAYKGYAELSKQLVKNRAISKMNLMQQYEVEKQVKDLAKTTIFTSKQVAQAQQYQFMAGMKANEVLKVTPKLLDFVTASGGDLALTADMVTDNLTAFGLGVEDIDRFLDVLMATANNANASVEDLGGAFKYIASSSRGFGENFEEVAIMLGVLADNGLKAEQSGARLRGIYSQLATITPKLGKALKKEGIEVYDKTTKKMKPLRDIMQQTKKAMVGMDDQKKNKMLIKMFGVQNLTAALSLLNASDEAIEKVEKSVKGANGEVSRMTKLTNETEDTKIKLLQSSFDALKTSIMEALSPTITDMIVRATAYMNELGESGALSPENINKFFDVLDKRISDALDNLKLITGAIAVVGAVLGSPVAAGVAIVGGVAQTYSWSDDFFKDKFGEKPKEKDSGQFPYKVESSGKFQEKEQLKEKEFLKQTNLAPVINITGNNTFNNGTDIEQLADEIVKQFNLTQ